MAVAHCVMCSYLFCEPTKMFDITTKWWRNTVVIRRAGSVTGRRQGGIHISDGSHRQRCHNIADRCQPLWCCLLISTTQQTWATVVRRVQHQWCQWRLHCWAWLSTVTVCHWWSCVTVTTTNVTQSQWNCSLWCRRCRRQLGVITPAHITQHRRWSLAEIWSHLTQVLHCRSPQHNTSLFIIGGFNQRQGEALSPHIFLTWSALHLKLFKLLPPDVRF